MSTGIPYLDEVWNPLTGCTPISEGCAHCWARQVQARFGGGPEEKPVWHQKRFEAPLHWRKPKRIGVCFMSDLWHESVDNLYIHSVFSMAAHASQHTYLFLTKRAERMAAVSRGIFLGGSYWLGATIENLPRAEERMSHLRSIRGNTWLSIEPLLGPINLDVVLPLWVKWMVVGCESGPGARECKTEWIESIVEWCASHRVPVYVKQIRVGRKVVHDVKQFPAHLRVQQYPEGWK